MDNEITKVEYFLRLLFPVRCICCDTVLPISTMGEVCPYCKESLKILQENVYEIGFNCSVSKIFAAFSYEGGIREAIHRLKFNDNPHVASVLVDLSCPILKKYLYSYKPYVSQSPIQDSLIIDGRKMIVKEQKRFVTNRALYFLASKDL